MLAALLLMIWDINRIQNYREGIAYASMSPDKRYKVSTAFTKSRDDFAYLITSLADNQIKAIVMLPYSWDGYQVRDVWLCGEEVEQCYGYTYDATGEADEIPLPPTLWQQAHAWLTIKIKGLENPQLTEIDRNKQQ